MLSKNQYDICNDNVHRFISFMQLLSNLNGAPIELYVHEDSGSYIDFCNRHRKTIANLVTVMDMSYNTEIKKCIQETFQNGLQKGGLMGELFNADEQSKELPYKFHCK